MSNREDFFQRIYKMSFIGASTLAQMDDTYGARLAFAMELAHLTGRDARSRLSAMLREQMGVSLSVQAIGQVLTKPERAFSAEISARVARLLRVDHYWLATGEGEPRAPGLSEDAISWARRYDRLEPDGRAKFSAAIVLAQPPASDKTVEERMPITAKSKRHHETHKD